MMFENQMTTERLAALFATHPDTDVFIITADGTPFFAEDIAASHAQRLFDKNLLTIERADLAAYDQASFADGLGEYTPAPGESMHPALQGTYNAFLQAEGGADLTHTGGVIVPASNILAGEEQSPRSLVHDAIKNALAEVKTMAIATADQVLQIVQENNAAAVAAGNAVNEGAAGISAELVAAPVLSLLEIAKNTPEAERTTHQKGLITKERNALAKAAAATTEGDTK